MSQYFLPLYRIPCNEYDFWRGGEIFIQNSKLSTLRSSPCPLLRSEAEGCHRGDSVTAGCSPDSRRREVRSELSKGSNTFRLVTSQKFPVR